MKKQDIDITQEFLEVSTREVILEMGENYGLLEHDISFSISYDDILKNSKVIYNYLAVQVKNNEDISKKETVKIPKGKYLTMYFNDSSIDNLRYYKQMIDYIKENNIKGAGDFLETAIILRVNKDGKENTLAKLEILCEL